MRHLVLMVFGLAICLFAASCCPEDPETYLDLCTEVSVPLCDRYIACGSPVERELCESALIDVCCGDIPGLCEREPETSRFSGCAEAWAEFSCREIRWGETPTECEGLL